MGPKMVCLQRPPQRQDGQANRRGARRQPPRCCACPARSGNDKGARSASTLVFYKGRAGRSGRAPEITEVWLAPPEQFNLYIYICV